MVWVQVLWLLLSTETLWPVLGQTAPVSPCPTLFWYEVDVSGNWRGSMNIPAPPKGSSLKTVVELEIDAVLPTQNVGILKLLENENEVWRRISIGNMVPVRFYVYFPLTWPLPILRSITSNGNIICIDNTSHTLVTKVTLQHLLYPTGGNTNYLQIQNINQVPNGTNYSPFVPNIINEPVYGVNPRIDVPYYDPGLNASSISTCPGVFDYQQSISGEWYGKISVPNPFPILAIDIVVEIYVTGDVPMITRGSLQLANNLVQEWNRMRTGENFFIQYKLEFPVQKSHTVAPPLPTVKNVIVNDRVLCSGDIPRYSIVATLTYKHSIFSDKCTSSSLNCPYNIEQSALPKPISPGYGQSSPAYEMTTQPSSPIYESTAQIHKASISTYSPTTHTYNPPTATSSTHRTSAPHPTPAQGSSDKIQCGTVVIKNSLFIAHGEETYAGQWPWHAALYEYIKRDFKYICGGTFVGTRTVITAAHCVNRKGAGDYTIHFGRYNLRNMNEEGSQYIDVRNILVHPSYNSTYTLGDIAVLILSKAVEVTAVVRPVCLWGQDDSSPGDIINQVGLVVGWGVNEKDEDKQVLMMIKMSVVSQQTCIKSDLSYFSPSTLSGTFCAGYRNGSSACKGDSGGGMVFPMRQKDGTEIWMLRGIVSTSRPKDNYSYICNTEGYIVFTDVVHYLDWINDILI